jgi:hypothetical protein
MLKSSASGCNTTYGGIAWLRTDFRQFGAHSEARMLTPTVLEVLAIKE